MSRAPEAGGVPSRNPAQEHVQVVSIGATLGRAVVRYQATTVREFVALLQRPNHPLRGVLALMWRLRQRPQDRHTWQEVEQQLAAPRREQWATLLFRQAYGLYVMLRYRANPRLPSATVELAGGIHVPRRALAHLRRMGLVPFAPYSREEVGSQAAQQMRNLWGSMAGVSVVVWFDSYYKPRLVYNPVYPAGGGGLNSTVMAVLHLPRLPRPMQYLPVAHWDAQRRNVAVMLRRHWPYLKEQIANVNRIRGSDQLPIRVPLDIHRDDVQSLQWLPLSLNPHLVGTTVGLVELLAFCEVLRDQARPPMPLLVDVDIHQRLTKLAYGLGTQGYPVRELLATMPPLFGVWHAYKYVCLVTLRVFLPAFTYLIQGTVEPGREAPTWAKLRRIELVLAAILRLPQRLIRRLETHAQRAQERYRQLAHLRMQRQLDILPSGAVAGLAAGAGGHGGRRPSPDEVRRARDRYLALESLRLLVTDFAPACFLLGYHVRSCNWAGREAGSAIHARRALQTATLVLFKLCQGGEHRVQYIRCLLSALCQWSEWHEQLPGCCFSEEDCEAGLARLAHSLNLHPNAMACEEANHHYLLVPPAAAGARSTGNHPLQQRYLDQVRQLVGDACDTRRNLVTFLPWQASPNAVAEAHWPHDAWLPTGVRGCPSREWLEDLILHAQRLLPVQRPWTDDLDQVCGDELGRRDEATTQAMVDELRAWLAAHPEPQRYRGTDQGRRVPYALGIR